MWVLFDAEWGGVAGKDERQTSTLDTRELIEESRNVKRVP